MAHGARCSSCSQPSWSRLSLSRDGFVRRALVVALSARCSCALPAETAYAFKRLFAVNGTSGLPLTLDQSVVFDWVDRASGRNRSGDGPVSGASADYWANVGFWWDLEFWNVGHPRGGAPNEFSGTPPGDFPKIDLRFDPTTVARTWISTRSWPRLSPRRASIWRGEPFTTQRGVIEPARPALAGRLGLATASTTTAGRNRAVGSDTRFPLPSRKAGRSRGSR